MNDLVYWLYSPLCHLKPLCERPQLSPFSPNILTNASTCNLAFSVPMPNIMLQNNQVGNYAMLLMCQGPKAKLCSNIDICKAGLGATNGSGFLFYSISMFLNYKSVIQRKDQREINHKGGTGLLTTMSFWVSSALCSKFLSA